MLRTISILGVNVHLVTRAVLQARIAEIIREDQHVLILNVNAQALNLACEHPWLRRFFNNAEIMFCDGFGVMLVARLLGYKIPERITYADWMWELASIAANSGYTMFFLGAKSSVAEKAALLLRGQFPDLKIVGTHHGYFNKRSNGNENNDIIEEISTLHPNLLVLGMGMPTQELWLMENWARINANIALTGGAVFDYVSGDLQRAPHWMTEHGLEWLGRLIIEPRKLWKRYLIGNPLFFWRVFIHQILRFPLPN